MISSELKERGDQHLAVDWIIYFCSAILAPKHLDKH